MAATARRAGFAPAAITTRFCNTDAGSRADADRHRRPDGHGDADQRPARRGRQHLDPVPRLQRHHDGRRRRPADAGGRARRHRDLHVHGRLPGHARLLQRHAGRPAGRDGPVRRDHRAARQRARRLRGRTAGQQSRRERDRAARSGARPTSGWRRRPTTTPRPATTASTCSSSRRWTRTSTRRRWRRSRHWAGLRRRGRGLQPRRSDRALPPGVLPDQRPLDAGRHGSELRAAVPAPALQRQPAHAPGGADAAAHHRPGALAAPVPRARQPRAHPGPRRQPDPERRPTRQQPRRPRCCSPPPPRRAWPWTGSSTTPAGA